MPTERQYELADAKAAGKTLQLVDVKTRKVLNIGDELTSFRGEKCKLKSFDPRHVYVQWEGGGLDAGYFPSVFDCEVVIEGEG